MNTFWIRTINEWCILNFWLPIWPSIDWDIWIGSCKSENWTKFQTVTINILILFTKIKHKPTKHNIFAHWKWCRNLFYWIEIFVMCHYAYLSRNGCVECQECDDWKPNVFNIFIFFSQRLNIFILFFKYGIFEPITCILICVWLLFAFNLFSFNLQKTKNSPYCYGMTVIGQTD